MNPSPEKKSPWGYRLRQRLWELDFLPTPPTDARGAKAAGRSNLLFCLSGMCYFFLYYETGRNGQIAWYAMFLALALWGSVCPDIHRGIRLPVGGKILAGITAVGTMGAGLRVALRWLSAGGGTVYLGQRLGVSPSLIAVGIGGAFGVAGLWFLYVLIARVYTALGAVFAHLFRGTGRKERGALVLLVLVLGVYTALAFAQSRAFYAPGHNYDVIYTADSPYLVMDNTWLNLTYAENDLRQPLFAVFSAPFVGWAYVLGQLVPAGSWVSPWLMNLPQLGLLVCGAYMLSALLCRGAAGRLAVTVSLLALYPSLLFSVMIEQYLVAVFWLLLFVYMTVEELPGRGGALLGAAGSLLTSAAMLPSLWMGGKPMPVKKMAKQALWALVLGGFLMAAFLRLEIVLSLGESVERLSGYAGESVPFFGRVQQFVIFLAGCFLFPNAGETLTLGYPSWQLMPPEGVNVGGMVVFAMCLCGAWLGRREHLVRIAAWWSLFSVVLLVGLGWGTAENGLILYGLYFSWGYYVLVRRWGVHLLERLGMSRWQTVADAIAAVALLGLNIPGVFQLLRFAVTNYPV